MTLTSTLAAVAVYLLGILTGALALWACQERLRMKRRRGWHRVEIGRR